MAYKRKKSKRYIQGFAAAVIIVLGAFFGKPAAEQLQQLSVAPGGPGGLVIDYLDVGQGDATLISKGNFHMLIDAGNNNIGELVTNYLKKENIEKLDVLIGTHPDADHIGGLDNVIYGVAVDHVYMPKASKKTKTFLDVLNALKKKGKSAEVPKIGKEVIYDGNLQIRFLSPSHTYTDANENSLVVQIAYGKTKFLFMGDAEVVNEKEMIKKGYHLECDVLKLGHHGSSTSTCDEFLKATDPVYAVISCGKGNTYGHPHQETLAKLEEDVQIYRTDTMGTVRAISDGKEVKMRANIN